MLDTPLAPSYGLRSEPGWHPGLDGAATLDLDALPLPAFGVELTGAPQQARQAANEQARALLATLPPKTKLDDDQKQVLRAYSGGGNLGESTDAYYTPTRLAALIWRLVEKLDPKARTVLEPACGTGAFLATAPAGMRLTGVEYDEDAARIAALLHPKAHIHHAPLETYHTTSADPRADVVIGNPPYGTRGETRVQDPAGQPFRRAEQYFLATALRRLMPGGLLAFVLPLSLLGDRHQAFRAELVRAGTVLLTALVPSGAFEAAGANLSTFVLIMKAHDQGVPAALATLPDTLQARFHSKRDTAFLAGTCCIDNNRLVSGHLCAATAKVEFGQYGQPLVRGEPVLTQARLDTLVAEASPLRAFAVTAAKLEGALLTWTDDTVQPVGEAETIPGLASVYRQHALSAMRRADRHPLADGTASPCGRFQYRRGQWHFATLLATPEAQTVLALARALQQQTLNRAPHPDLPQLWADLRRWAGDDEEAQRQRIARLARQYPTVNLVLSPPALPAKRRMTILPGALGDVAAQLAATWQLTRPALTLHSGLPDEQVSTFLRAHYRFNGSVWVAPTEYDFGHAYEKAAQARETARQWPHQSPEQLALLSQADELEKRALAQARSIADTPLTPRDPLVPEEVLRDWVNTYLGTVSGGEPLLHVIKERGLTRLVMRDGQAGDVYRVDQTLTRRLQDYLNYDTPTDRIEREGHSAESIEAQRARALKKAARYERSLELHFRSWLIHSPHAGPVEDLYNRTRNAFVLAPEDTSLLDLPLWRGPRHHLYQRGDIRTLAAWGHGLLAYEVGVGKTFTLLGLLSLLKQRGEAHRPWIVTPLSLTGNWVINIHKARPDWQVAVIGMNPTGTFDDEGLPEYTPDTTPQRKAKLAELLHQPPDVVVISMEAFTDIPMLDSTRLHLIENDAALLAQGAAQEEFSVKSGEFRGARPW
ncbi:N-6 DNA methylase [Deinococcus multiflagellatus]|uniref:N-6 DNA methylase n=1 Tax=Deinococcus multiflagellatus TaxID=1656887 RepID=A0ABW1ZUC5_9DEIO